MFKIMLVGCGSMSNTWVEYVKTRSDAQIVSLVDIKDGAAELIKQKHQLSAPTYKDINLAIRETSPNLLMDCTTPDAHADLRCIGLQNGLDIMGEKPMAESVEQGYRIIEQEAASGKSHAIMQNRRFDKNIRAFKHLIKEENIGSISYMKADFFIGAHFGGFRDVMDNVLILDMAIHTFDSARFLMGRTPISVYCHEFNPSWSWYKGNACAICIFEFNDGSVFQYSGSWCAEGVNTTWESQWRVFGKNGGATWDGAENMVGEKVTPAQGEQPFINEMTTIMPEFTYNGQSGHFGCLDDMFASLIAKIPAQTNSKDNIDSIKMVFAAIESANTGKKVYF